MFSHPNWQTYYSTRASNKGFQVATLLELASTGRLVYLKEIELILQRRKFAGKMRKNTSTLIPVMIQLLEKNNSKTWGKLERT